VASENATLSIRLKGTIQRLLQKIVTNGKVVFLMGHPVFYCIFG